MYFFVYILLIYTDLGGGVLYILQKSKKDGREDKVLLFLSLVRYVLNFSSNKNNVSGDRRGKSGGFIGRTWNWLNNKDKKEGRSVESLYCLFV